MKKDIYFALPHTTTIYSGKIKYSITDKSIIKVNGLSGVVELSNDEIFHTLKDAEQFVLLKKIKDDINVVNSWNKKDILKYLISFLPRNNNYEERLAEGLIWKIMTDFKINLKED